MIFDELNEETYILFAIKHYENPHCVTREDFDEDMKRFKYLKRLLKRYVRGGALRTHLIINHLIILYNVFGEAATPLLFFRLEREYWSILKTILIYLNKYPLGMLPDLDIDNDIQTLTRDLGYFDVVNNIEEIDSFNIEDYLRCNYFLINRK